ncbi:histone-lysine N-methyltransferase, H3 lysine-79 specific isoform X2 [Plutella xylostella]|nr:histone-lysine N-methyltransferase, H3 lysine-79 specific isoform X2 [Plutella xylostella]
MSHLYLPWGGERSGRRLRARDQFASSLELHEREPAPRQRSPSLPPIRHDHDDTTRTKEVLNRNLSTSKRFSFYDEDGEGDTSGYGSETVNHRTKSGAFHDLTANHNPVLAWHNNPDDNRNRPTSGDRSPGGGGGWAARSPRGGTAEEGRPRWGDRGVATGRLWEPTEPNERLPQMPNQKKGTPSWVERGLNMIDNTAEVLVIDQTSSNSSGFDCDRSSCHGSDEGRTFLRGQNVPLEPEIKAQRENKRIKALELQTAIMNQLEDREKRRQEERERKLKEEKLEELRIQREQEQDRLRLEHEKRRSQEKQLLEQRKLETLKKALEDAERNARLEKEKRFSLHKTNVKNNIQNEINFKSEEHTMPIEDDNISRTTETISPTKTSRTYEVHSAKSQTVQSNKDFNSHHTTECSSPRSLGTGNLNLFIHSVPPISITDSQNQFSIVPLGINGEIMNQQNGIQLAVLVPQTIGNSMCSVSLNSLNTFTESMESGKVLTPSKYRATRNNKDAFTQTDSVLFNYSVSDKANSTDDIQRNIDKDYSKIDENAPQETHNTLKKDRRFRSEERFKKDIENRPKWGVNRPAAQYKKQSEKDPFYSQKRKMRTKHRTQTRQYTSSEDSRSPSPPPARPDVATDTNKHRNSLSQSYWRNKRSNQEELKQSDPDGQSELNCSLTINEIVTDTKKSPTNSKMSPNKRLTLSQKFINDKYGNRKLWVEDSNKTHTLDSDNRKKMLDQINTAKRDYFMSHNEDQENIVIRTKF